MRLLNLDYLLRKSLSSHTCRNDGTLFSVAHNVGDVSGAVLAFSMKRTPAFEFYRRSLTTVIRSLVAQLASCRFDRVHVTASELRARLLVVSVVLLGDWKTDSSTMCSNLLASMTRSGNDVFSDETLNQIFSRVVVLSAGNVSEAWRRQDRLSLEDLGSLETKYVLEKLGSEGSCMFSSERGISVQVEKTSIVKDQSRVSQKDSVSESMVPREAPKKPAKAQTGEQAVSPNQKPLSLDRKLSSQAAKAQASSPQEKRVSLLLQSGTGELVNGAHLYREQVRPSEAIPSNATGGLQSDYIAVLPGSNTVFPTSGPQGLPERAQGASLQLDCLPSHGQNLSSLGQNLSLQPVRNSSLQYVPPLVSSSHFSLPVVQTPALSEAHPESEPQADYIHPSSGGQSNTQPLKTESGKIESSSLIAKNGVSRPEAESDAETDSLGSNSPVLKNAASNNRSSVASSNRADSVFGIRKFIDTALLFEDSDEDD